MSKPTVDRHQPKHPKSNIFKVSDPRSDAEIEAAKDKFHNRLKTVVTVWLARPDILTDQVSGELIRDLRNWLPEANEAEWKRQAKAAPLELATTDTERLKSLRVTVAQFMSRNQSRSGEAANAGGVTDEGGREGGEGDAREGDGGSVAE